MESFIIGLWVGFFLGIAVLCFFYETAEQPERKALIKHAVSALPNDSLTTGQLMIKFEILEGEE